MLMRAFTQGERRESATAQSEVARDRMTEWGVPLYRWLEGDSTALVFILSEPQAEP